MQTCTLTDKLCGLTESYNRTKDTLIQFSLFQHFYQRIRVESELFKMYGTQASMLAQLD